MSVKLIITPSVCQFCGCTEDNACNTPDGPCQWADEFNTVCSNLECVEKALEAGIGIWPEFCPEEDGRYEDDEEALRDEA